MSDEFHWGPSAPAALPAGAVTFGEGRAPRMTYMPWHSSQGVELGGVDASSWYRRCVVRGCRVWAGPYEDLWEAKEHGLDHKYLAHR